MTERQIEKKLQKAGINTDNIEIRKDEVEIYVTDNNGDYDDDATELLATNASMVLGWGGFNCRSGAWIFQNGYKIDEVNEEEGFCNTMHY